MKWVWRFYWGIIVGYFVTVGVFTTLTIREDAKFNYYQVEAHKNLHRADCYLNNGNNCSSY